MHVSINMCTCMCKKGASMYFLHSEMYYKCPFVLVYVSFNLIMQSHFFTLLLFNYSCLHFLPTPAKPTSLPCFHPPPWFCPCVLYSSSWKPFSPISPPHSPLAIVRLFLTSMSLVIFCLLFISIDYVPVKGESRWYLSLTAWLISLSIMLSRSIHAVEKGRSSFFLGAAQNSIV